MNKLIIYRDSVQIKEVDVAPQDTAKVLEIEDLTPDKGYYVYFAKVMDTYQNISQESNHLIAYSGETIELSNNNLYNENFDNNIPKYFISGNWNKTDEFAFSQPHSFTESPYNNYKNNEKDTFMLFPMHTTNGFVNIRFFNAAILDARDTAVVEYSIDNGKTWSNRFQKSDSQYIEAKYSYDDFEAWRDGVLDEKDWRMENLYLSNINEQFLLRFRFASNVLKSDKGWFIDDLSISNTILNINEIVQNIQIYPNPVREFLNLYLGENTNKPLTISIYDLLGNLVMKKQYSSFAGTNLIINIEDLQTGYYFIDISDTKVFARGSIIKL